MQAAREVYECNAVILLPSVRKKYTLTQGTLAETTLILGAKKILEPARFTISWASSKIVAEDY